MKHILVLILAASFLFAGCNTPNKAENTALNIAKVEVATVEAAMRSFIEYERRFGASAELRAKVDAAYQKVKHANLSAEGLWIGYKKAQDQHMPNTPVLLEAYQRALQSVTFASAELIAFVVTITTKP